jgi:hypothetical protein
VRRVVLLAWLAACGRVGFEPPAPVDVADDAGVQLACDPACPATHYCGHSLGDCSSPPTCIERPTTCAGVPTDPVCGCDGQTYDNRCVASRAETGVAATGTCPAVDGCSPPCGPAEYCATPIGMCDAVGTCQPRPTSCEGLGTGACGCDLVEYISVCQAAIAGTSVLILGAGCPM